MEGIKINKVIFFLLTLFLISFIIFPINAITHEILTINGSTVDIYKGAGSMTWVNPSPSSYIWYFMTGAGGGAGYGGGGGAGVVLNNTATVTGDISIIIGAKGLGQTVRGTRGENTSISGSGINTSIQTAFGGGAGGNNNASLILLDGGNGGGGAIGYPENIGGYSWDERYGYFSPYRGSRGSNGDSPAPYFYGGYGGSSGSLNGTGHGGRDGVSSSITGNVTYYAGGGACGTGAGYSCPTPLGGGGAGFFGSGNGYPATYYGSGGGGSGLGSAASGGNGYDGIVIIRSLPIPPTANFTANPLNGTAPLMVQFIDTSFGAPTGFNWTFGDGTVSLLQNPLHQYFSSGSYNVSLSVTNPLGNSSITKPYYINVTGVGVIFNLFINVQNSITGADITDSVNSALYYNNTWYNETPPYYENLGDVPTNFTLWRNNPYANNKNSLVFFYDPNKLTNNESLSISKPGYLSKDTILFPMLSGTRYIKLIPLNSYSTISEYNFTKVITVYDSNGKTDITPIDVKIRHTPDFEYKQVNPLTGVVYFENNPCGNFIGEVYNRNTAQEIYNWTFSNVCDANKKVTNGSIYQKEIWLSDLNVWVTLPLPTESLYVFAKDGITGGDIAPYEVSIEGQPFTGMWHNYTVIKNLGVLTGHVNLEAGKTYKIYVSSNGYITGYNQIFLTATSGHKTDINIPLYKSVSPVGFTIWNINVYDALTIYPIPNATVGIWEGLTPLTVGLTNNAGSYAINITNSSIITTYDIVTSKSGYKTKTTSATPNGDVYTNNIYLTPINIAPVVTTYIPIINVTNNTPIIGIGLSGSKNYCRLILDWNNETFFSPLTNIEACIGIENINLQNYILASLIIIICGIFAAKKAKSVIAFLIGAIAGDTICLLTGLIEWQAWVIIILPLVLVYFISKEKIKI